MLLLSCIACSCYIGRNYAWEEHKLRACENKVLRIMFGDNRKVKKIL
jgi:hypothetical protein